VGPAIRFTAKLKATWQAGSMIGIVVVTIGGIYAGLFTPTEAAGVGAFLALLLALFRRQVTVNSLASVLLQSVRTTAFVFLILIGAFIFSPFLALTHIPSDLAELLVSLELPRFWVLLILLASYIVLGTFLEGFAMLVLTLPVVHPIIVVLEYDPIWFGVVMVIVLEMGLISPPVGVNVFVVKGIAEDVPMSQIFVGILPFWIAMGVCLAILVAFPEIALYLPNRMIE
jgi:tripartite ATP-independent transporter DctM subunit